MNLTSNKKLGHFRIHDSIRACLAFFLLPLLLAGCERAPVDPIRIAINTWPGYEFLYLAQETGLFEEEGANVRLLEFSSLGDCRQAFDRGQADGMCCTLIELLIARTNESNDPRIVLLSDYSNGPDVILGHSPLESVAALRGQRVGAEVGSLNIFLLARALSLQGMTLSDVEVHQYDQESMEESFIEGRIDAVVTYPPHSTRLIKAHTTNTLFTSADIPGEVLDIVCLNQEIVQERFDEVVGMVRAWDRSLEYARENPQASLQIMAEREGISAEEFELALEGVNVMSSKAQLELIKDKDNLNTTFELVHQVLLETNQIKEPVSIENLISARPIEAAANR